MKRISTTPTVLPSTNAGADRRSERRASVYRALYIITTLG
jgi:hypothetical protein